MIVDDPQRRPW